MNSVLNIIADLPNIGSKSSVVSNSLGLQKSLTEENSDLLSFSKIFSEVVSSSEIKPELSIDAIANQNFHSNISDDSSASAQLSQNDLNLNILIDQNLVQQYKAGISDGTGGISESIKNSFLNILKSEGLATGTDGHNPLKISGSELKSALLQAFLENGIAIGNGTIAGAPIENIVHLLPQKISELPLPQPLIEDIHPAQLQTEHSAMGLPEETDVLSKALLENRNAGLSKQKLVSPSESIKSQLQLSNVLSPPAKGTEAGEFQSQPLSELVSGNSRSIKLQADQISNQQVAGQELTGKLPPNSPLTVPQHFQGAVTAKNDRLETLKNSLDNLQFNSKSAETQPASLSESPVSLTSSHLMKPTAQQGSLNAPKIPLNALAVHIATQASNGAKRFEIRLDPPELGRIDVRLDVARDGMSRTLLLVERPETLEMLQRDARALERALNDSGLQTNKYSLSFSLKDQNSSGHRSFDDDFDDSKFKEELPTESVEDANKILQESLKPNYIAKNGLDIRI